MITVAAADALSDSAFPFMGIVTRWSQAAIVSFVKPFPSFPITVTHGSRKDISLIFSASLSTTAA